MSGNVIAGGGVKQKLCQFARANSESGDSSLLRSFSVNVEEEYNRVDRDPYPGNPTKIRQDFRPFTCSVALMDAAPRFGASSGLRTRGGLAVPGWVQEGDPLSGLTRILVDNCLPG